MVIFSNLRSETPTTNKKHQPQRTKTQTGEKRKPQRTKIPTARNKNSEKRKTLQPHRKSTPSSKAANTKNKGTITRGKEQSQATSKLKLKKTTTRLSQPNGNCEI